MSDEHTPLAEPLPAPPLATPAVERRRDWLPSLIWLIPIVAALVGYRAHPSLMLVVVYAAYWLFMLRAMRPARQHA